MLLNFCCSSLIFAFTFSGYYCLERMARLVSYLDRLSDPNGSYLDPACRDTQTVRHPLTDRGRTVLVPCGWAQGLPRHHAAQGVRYREVPLLHKRRWTRRNVMREEEKRDAPPSICNLASEVCRRKKNLERKLHKSKVRLVCIKAQF